MKCHNRTADEAPGNILVVGRSTFQMKRKALIIVLLAGLLFIPAAWIALSPPVAMPFYARILFQNWRFPTGFYDVSEIAGIQRQDVFFDAPDGEKLHGWWFPN